MYSIYMLFVMDCMQLHFQQYLSLEGHVVLTYSFTLGY